MRSVQTRDYLHMPGLWKNKEKQDYGLIGELHEKLEKEEQFSLKQNAQGRVSYGDKKAAFKTDKGKKLATKLQGLYAVMDQIKAQDTFVTADMIPKEMRKECDKKYGILHVQTVAMCHNMPFIM